MYLAEVDQVRHDRLDERPLYLQSRHYSSELDQRARDARHGKTVDLGDVARGSHVVRWTRMASRRRLGPGTVSSTNAAPDARSCRSAAADRWLITDDGPTARCAAQYMVRGVRAAWPTRKTARWPGIG